jgi:hypothetical protein
MLGFPFSILVALPMVWDAPLGSFDKNLIFEVRHRVFTDEVGVEINLVSRCFIFLSPIRPHQKFSGWDFAHFRLKGLAGLD